MGAKLIVIGGGIVGAVTARELVLRGHDVTLIEKDGLGGAVTGASLACIGAHMNSRNEINILTWAMQAWAALEARLGHSMEYKRCGQLRFLESDDDRSIALDWIAFDKKHGIESQFLEPDQVRTVEPLLTAPIKAATYAPGAATVTPFLAVRAIVKDAMENGLTLRRHAEVRCIHTHGTRACGVTTNEETLDADAIVVAAGPWTRQLAATAGLDVPILPRRAQCLASIAVLPSIRCVIAACESHGGVAAGYTQIQQAPSGQILFNTVLEGGLSQPGAQDHVPEVDAVFIRNSIQKLLWLFPSLSRIDLLRSWIRYEAVTPDDRFLAGPTPIENLYLAAGDGGSGFTRALAVGRVIADILDERNPPFDADVWVPSRFALRGSA